MRTAKPTRRAGRTTEQPAPLMPEVMDAMAAAVARRRRVVPGRRRRIVRGGGLGLVLVLVSGTALAATGIWNPLRGTSGKHYTLAAPPALQSASLAVLRRAPTAQDHSPLMAAYLQRLSQHGWGRVRLRYVRFLRTIESGAMTGEGAVLRRSGVTTTMVLAPQAGSTPYGPVVRAPKLPNALCLNTLQDTWPDPAAPPSRSFIGNDPRPARLIDRLSFGGTCVSIQQIRIKGVTQGAWNYGSISGVVPDGVAVVRATTRTGVVISDRVVNNSFELLAPGRATAQSPPGRNGQPVPAGQFRHGTMEWVAPDGRVIRHLPY